ncbi:EFR1 family ferrodoxin [Treponema sp. OttesenSCG-928-L16]|nr:EFR1 family ferrodoxin [Treponema sp. OttesenSCG-928-L16]
MKNRIYFFTGTGNSLKAAKDIAASLGNCEITAIRKGMDTNIPAGYERIGFVFPVYFFGLPEMVAEFVRRSNLSKETAGYFFALATPGGVSGKPLAQMERLFSEKGIHLDYGNKIRMNANYIIRYGSMGLYYKTAMAGYGRRMDAIIGDIKDKKTRAIEKYSKRIEDIYLDSIRGVHETDKMYKADERCTSCGICAEVCPAANITMNKGRPEFRHQCESCMACIQYCPQKALNYGDKTRKRKRYTHPDIGYTELTKYYSANR